MNLPGKVALITGGKRLGAAIGLALAGRGAAVIFSYNRSQTDSEAAVAGVIAAGGRAAAVPADVTRAGDCESLVKRTVELYGRLDVLLNMASLYEPIPFDQLTPESWDRQLAVDLRSSFLCARAAVPVMRLNGGGRIVNFADWIAASGRPRYIGYLPYYVGKSAIVALTQGLALELAKDQVLVNAIAPGPILAPPGMSNDELKAVERATPLGRWGGEQEIVKAVLLLIETDFITGETIRVDGGRHIK